MSVRDCEPLTAARVHPNPLAFWMQLGATVEKRRDLENVRAVIDSHYQLA